MLTDEVLTRLDSDLEAAIEEPWDDAPDKAALQDLREDLPRLRYFGMLVCLSEAEGPEEAVHTEHVDAVRKRLLQGIAGDPEAEVDLEAAPALPELIEQYKDQKGESGAKCSLCHVPADTAELAVEKQRLFQEVIANETPPGEVPPEVLPD